MSEEIIIPIVIFGCIAYIVKISLDAKMRNRLIDRGEINENLKYLFVGYQDRARRSNIKWGIVLLGIGLAMLSKQLAPFYLTDESVFGLIFIFAGIGFLTFYFISGKNNNNGQTG